MDTFRQLLAYSIDGQDRLVAVSGEWEEFARANGAPQLARERVLGRSLWEFIDGQDTLEVHRLLLDRIRVRGAGVTLAFRCDGPRLRRDMQMVLEPGQDGRVEIRTHLVHESRRPYVALFDAAAQRSGSFLKVCSWCRKVEMGGLGWAEAEHAVRELRLLEIPPVPRISHGMCPACLEGFRERLAGQ
jgi:hypothetical protein